MAETPGMVVEQFTNDQTATNEIAVTSEKLRLGSALELKLSMSIRDSPFARASGREGENADHAS